MRATVGFHTILGFSLRFVSGRPRARARASLEIFPPVRLCNGPLSVSLSPRFWRARFSAGGADYFCVGFHSAFPRPGKANDREGNLFFDLAISSTENLDRRRRHRDSRSSPLPRIFRHRRESVRVFKARSSAFLGNDPRWRTIGTASRSAFYAARATLAQSALF